MDTVEICLGGIVFKATREWMFFPYENFILARRDSQKGILKIALAESSNSRSPSAGGLFETARGFVSRENLPEPFDVKEPQPGAYLFGAASFKISEKNRDYLTRVLYLSRGKDMIFATYGCPWERREEEAVQQELYQCEKMILSVRFASRETPESTK